MAWPSEVGNTFTIPITGGAGPCPNGAMRSGTLQVTCGAAATSFNVVENPMCTYAMTYVTTQACPSPVPVSYFSNYQGVGMANAPYTLSFSTAKVYNGGTGECRLANAVTVTACNRPVFVASDTASPPLRSVLHRRHGMAFRDRQYVHHPRHWRRGAVPERRDALGRADADLLRCHDHLQCG